jgi:ABC-type sugar transport system ATPase subunit
MPAVGRGGSGADEFLDVLFGAARATDIFVFIHLRRIHAAGNDNVLRRHWAVVCADRRGARER